MLKNALFPLLILLFFLNPESLTAQDTLRAMSYNLMNFRSLRSDDCSTSNTTPGNLLKSILDYTHPDLFAIQELVGSGNGPLTYLMDLNVTRSNPHYHLVKADIAHQPGGNTAIHVAIIFDSTKLVPMGTTALPVSSGRTSVAYHFKLKCNPGLQIDAIVAHFKAELEDSSTRILQANAVMQYLKSVPPNTYALLMGDLNLYSHIEGGFKTLVQDTDSLRRLYDPLGPNFNWKLPNKSSRRALTQSTHKNLWQNRPECWSDGGLDDRFDFILLSHALFQDTSTALHYIPGSYCVFGNDGTDLDGKNINDSTNHALDSLSSTLLDTLFFMSDHLPVILELAIDSPCTFPVSVESSQNSQIQVFTDPSQDQIGIHFPQQHSGQVQISLYSLSGTQVLQTEYSPAQLSALPGKTLHLNTQSLPPGLYLLHITTPGKLPEIRKVLIL